MSTHHSKNSQEEKQAIKRFLIAKEGRRYEIDKFWQRSSFFWVFIAAAFIAYGKSDPNNSFPFACFGLVSSFAWTLQNRGSKYWQEAWEQKIDHTETEVLGKQVFHRIEERQKKGFWGGWRFSVSRLTVAISDFSVLVWLWLAVFASHIADDFFHTHWKAIYVAILVATVIYCFLIACFARDRSQKKSEEGGENGKQHPGEV
jgi:hypothetical protein